MSPTLARAYHPMASLYERSAKLAVRIAQSTSQSHSWRWCWATVQPPATPGIAESKRKALAHSVSVTLNATSPKMQRVSVEANPLSILVGREGVEPSTNGLRESSFSQVVIQINLLQHTPSSKRSYTQPESNCKELNEVTKWLRSLPELRPNFRIGQTMDAVEFFFNDLDGCRRPIVLKNSFRRAKELRSQNSTS